MRGSDTVRRAGSNVSSLIVGALALGAIALTAPPASADTVVGGQRLAEHGLIVDLPSGLPKPPKVTAASYVLADLETGQIIAAKDPHRRLRPASTLKMLTALTLLPRLDKEGTYVAHRSDVLQDGSSVGLVEGHKYTINQLFLGMLLPSGNDAAHALARAGGGVGPTRKLMQAEAKRLQALDTSVVNSSGLDEPGQFSSAYDLALFARAGMSRADFRRYVGMRTAEFPGEYRRETYQIQNQNRLLGKFPGTIGVKTGYTTMARNTFAVAVKRDGRTLLLTLMRSDAGIREDAMALMEWGFVFADQAEPVGQLVDPVPPAAAPTAPVNEVPARDREQVALSPAFPFAGFAAPAAASAGGLFLVSGLTALGVKRRRRRRRVRAELAYRAARFSQIAYSPPPGPLEAHVRSMPLDQLEIPIPEPAMNCNGRPRRRPELPDDVDLHDRRYGEELPFPPDGPELFAGPFHPDDPEFMDRPFHPDDPEFIDEPFHPDDPELVDGRDGPGPLYPPRGRRLDLDGYPDRRYSRRPTRG
ncbi:MAG: D-alanyl-D-alanine carboxypeptidase [Sporichthyaceae bacterium]|nr:D-alanyl-D-alanine carboxypeptidase [Sporichthyaceae bacterium]